MSTKKKAPAVEPPSNPPKSEPKITFSAPEAEFIKDSLAGVDRIPVLAAPIANMVLFKLEACIESARQDAVG